MAVNPSLFANMPYDPVRDFVPVGMLAEFPFVVVVSNNFPAHSIKELIELAKAGPARSTTRRPATAPDSNCPWNCSS